MALQFLDMRVFGPYVVDAWQNHLNTDMDPASGKWFTHGPDNSGGLFGGLTDSLGSSLVFDENQQVFAVHPDTGYTDVLNNLNGLLPDTGAQFTVSDSIAVSSTTTHQTSNTLKVGVGEDIKATAKFGGSGVDFTTKLSFEYSFSWSDTKATTQSETKTISQQMTVKVPVGKAYKAIVTYKKAELTVPYSALVYLDGVSEANLPSAINGQTKITVDAGTLCSWIDKYGSAAGDSLHYGADPTNPQRGIIALKGEMSADQSFDFAVEVLDVTAELKGTGKATSVSSTPVAATTNPS